MNRRLILVALLLAGSVAPLFGQKTEMNKQLNVTRAYEPNVTEAAKINLMPKEESDIRVETEFDYSLAPSPLTEVFGVRNLTPYLLATTPEKMLKPGYLKVGVGFPFHTEADLYYSSRQHAKTVYGIYANHSGMFTKLKNEQQVRVPANQSLSTVGAFGLYRFSDRYSVEAGAQYSYESVTRYGYNDYDMPDFELFDTTKNGLRQNFNVFKGHLSVGSSFSDMSYFNAKFGVDFATLKDKFGYSENSTDLQLKVGQNVVNENHSLSLSADLKWISPNEKMLEGDKKQLLSIEPQYRYAQGPVEFRIGAKFAYDLQADKSKLFPTAYLQYAAAEGRFTPYLRVEGGYQMNSYLDLIEENPYLLQGVSAPKTALRTYGVGVKGNIASTLSYNIFGEVAAADSAIYFVTAPLQEDSFGNTSAIVSDKTTAYYTFGVELLSDLSNKFNLYTKIQYTQYDPENLLHAYGKPNWQALLRVKYQVTERVSASAKAQIEGPRYFKEPLVWSIAEHEKNVPVGVNIGIGIDYDLLNTVKLYLNVDNLANQKLYQFNNYRSLGINATVGARMSF